MAISIVLIRHAATKKSSPDKLRPISEEGILQAKRCAVLLHAEAPFDLAITSSALRAKNTLEVILNELKQTPPIIEIDTIYQPASSNDRIAVDAMLKTLGKKPVESYIENDANDSWNRYKSQAIDDVMKVLARYRPHRVLIVGHGNIINSIGLGLAPSAVELKNIYFHTCEGFEIYDAKLHKVLRPDFRAG